MKRIILNMMITTGFLGIFGCSGSNDPSTWSQEQTNKWFEKAEWANGFNIAPDASIDRQAFAVYYHKNPERWNKAFEFLKNNDLNKLEIKKYELDGENLFVTVSEYTSKNPEEGKYEAHRKYTDIQYVASGAEQIGIAPITSRDSTLQEYDGTKDIEFLTTGTGKLLRATPERFFLFFPSDAHMPGIKVEKNDQVRKIVVKVKID